ncbi:MAG: hypothetical protein U9N34_01535 [Candidatus Cloacimonadota bacterium]|nr:hypothetical protein [Candidatus Cloacimonadota bacterium]
MIHYQDGLYVVAGKHKFGISEARFHHLPYSMDDNNWEIYN